MLVLAALLCVAGDLRAASAPWPDRAYSHFSHRENVSIVLEDLATRGGIPVSISGKVGGRVNAAFEGMSLENAFELLVEAFGLNWYYDGDMLWVYTLEDIHTSTIRLRTLPVAVFEERLSRLGLLDRRLPWRALEAEGLVYVSGPERYVELVGQMAEELDGKEEYDSGDLFMWVDGDGITHYSNEPPPDYLPTGVQPLPSPASDHPDLTAVYPTVAGRTSPERFQ